MSDDDREQSDLLLEACTLIDAALDGTESPGAGERLESLLLQHDSVRKLYVRYLHQECTLASHATTLVDRIRIDEDQEDPALEGSLSLDDAGFYPAVYCEPTTESEIAAVPPSPVRGPAVRRAGSPWFRPRFYAAALILLSATLAILLYRSRFAAAATITTVLNARIGGEGACARPNNRAEPVNAPGGWGYRGCLWAGRRAVIEAPADFTVDSGTALTLIAGKVRASADGAAHGFVVKIPDGMVTDLGTEFGVACDRMAGTQVHVFRGSVQLEASGVIEKITAGNAGVLSNGSIKVVTDGARPQLFISSLTQQSAPLELADLISGGDGLTHRRGYAIDPLTGNLATFAPVKEVTGDAIYHPVPLLPVVDGCFVPSGSSQIDSAGHIFAFRAAGHRTFDRIRTEIPASNVSPDWDSARLGGIDYARPGHSFIYMHANKGLTIDLSAVRHLHPGMPLSKFNAVAGNAAAVHRSSLTNVGKADVLVLVDGVLRFKRRRFRQAQRRSTSRSPSTIRIVFSRSSPPMAATASARTGWSSETRFCNKRSQRVNESHQVGPRRKGEIKPKEDSVAVTGDFDAGKLVEAFNDAGFTVKAAAN